MYIRQCKRDNLKDREALASWQRRGGELSPRRKSCQDFQVPTGNLAAHSSPSSTPGTRPQTANSVNQRAKDRRKTLPESSLPPQPVTDLGKGKLQGYQSPQGEKTVPSPSRQSHGANAIPPVSNTIDQASPRQVKSPSVQRKPPQSESTPSPQKRKDSDRKVKIEKPQEEHNRPSEKESRKGMVTEDEMFKLFATCCNILDRMIDMKERWDETLELLRSK